MTSSYPGDSADRDGWPLTWAQLQEWMAHTFLNADLVPVGVIPWDEDAGLMVDQEDSKVRIGVYADLTADTKWTAMLEAPTPQDAMDALDYLTEEQPEGTDWAAWAAQRVQDWDWPSFRQEVRP